MDLQGLLGIEARSVQMILAQQRNSAGQARHAVQARLPGDIVDRIA
jgi:hypothetical protein